MHIGYTPHFVYKHLKGLHITDIAGKAWRVTALDLENNKSGLAFLGQKDEKGSSQFTT